MSIVANRALPQGYKLHNYRIDRAISRGSFRLFIARSTITVPSWPSRNTCQAASCFAPRVRASMPAQSRISTRSALA